MKNWLNVYLKDIIISVNTGLDAIKRAPIVEKETGIKCLRIQDISQKKPYECWGNTSVTNQNFENFRLREGEIIMARTCSTGLNLFVKNNMNAVFNNGLVRIRSDISKVLAKYLYYLFMTRDFIGHVDSISGGTSVQLNMQVGDLLTYNLLLPPLPEQERIAEVLSSLDDKIDLLHKQNKTLEEMAETLFRQWFVEEENPQEIIGKVLKTTSGGTPSRTNDSYFKGTIPWVKSKELNNSFILTTEEFISEEALKNSSAKLLKPYTVMIAMYGATIGEIGIIEKVSTCNQAICAIEPNADFPFTFIYQYFKSIKSDLINLAVGGAQQNISQDLIKGLEIPTAPEKIIKYHHSVLPFYGKILNNVKQIQQLETLRDTLLPKLMSGLVKVDC